MYTICYIIVQCCNTSKANMNKTLICVPAFLSIMEMNKFLS